MKETKKTNLCAVLIRAGNYFVKVEVKPSKGSFRYYVITLGGEGGFAKV